MRFKLGFKLGEIRTRKVFPIIPKVIGNDIIWLEKITITEQYQLIGSYDEVFYYHKWKVIGYKIGWCNY